MCVYNTVFTAQMLGFFTILVSKCFYNTDVCSVYNTENTQAGVRNSVYNPHVARDCNTDNAHAHTHINPLPAGSRTSAHPLFTALAENTFLLRSTAVQTVLWITVLPPPG